jgi:hypothetical protein
MATLETQYKNFLSDNPDSKLTFEEWSLYYWRFSNMEIPQKEPYVSDDFQIGPDGAYEHSDREIDFDQVLKNVTQKLLIIKYKNGDLGDLGNEIGIAVGEVVKDMTESETNTFISGIRHGISLTNGTH